MSAKSPGKDNLKTKEANLPPEPQEHPPVTRGDALSEQHQKQTEPQASQQWQEPLSILADIATDKSLELQQRRPTNTSTSETLAEASRILATSEDQPGTSGLALSHPGQIEGEISESDLYQKLAEFDEAAFEIASSAGSHSIAGDSSPAEEPFDKYRRDEYIPNTISSSSYYSSSSSSNQCC